MRDETGSVSAEYGILLAGIVAMLVLIVFGLGVQIGSMFNVMP